MGAERIAAQSVNDGQLADPRERAPDRGIWLRPHVVHYRRIELPSRQKRAAHGPLPSNGRLGGRILLRRRQGPLSEPGSGRRVTVRVEFGGGGAHVTQRRRTSTRLALQQRVRQRPRAGSSVTASRDCIRRLADAYSVLLNMSKPKPYARVAITLPEKDLHAADRLAARHDRSRSWIIAEALRRYVAVDETENAQELRANVAWVAATPARDGIGESRRAQLRRDLTLTPEQRVREAEETLQLTDRGSPAPAHSIRAFDHYDEFLDYQRRRDLPR